MRFTMENTVREIIENETTKELINVVFEMPTLDFLPGSMFDIPLSEVKRTFSMPWGLPFPSETLVDAGNFALDVVKKKKYLFISLWDKRVADTPPVSKNEKSSVCLLTTTKPDDEAVKPCAIICPGGGYTSLAAIEEGVETADRMEKEGYRAFVLFYRVSPHYYPEPQLDLALAVRTVRKNADSFGVDPERLMVMGYSAGGHLCASFAAYWEEYEKKLMSRMMSEDSRVSLKPDMVCLGYPVVSFTEEYHYGSFVSLTGGDEMLRDKLSIERHIEHDYPPTYIWTCEDDALVPPSNSLRMADALKKAGVRVKLDVFPSGGHGCALAKGLSAEPWFDNMLAFFHS